jgi:hypothetical protein
MSNRPMSTKDAVNDPVDHLGLNATQLGLAETRLALRPLPVDPMIADRQYAAGETAPGSEAGAVHLASYESDKIERFTVYRYHRSGVLNEHLCHGWAAKGYDFPTLTTVVFEFENMTVVGADLLPIADVAFDRTYYGRWMIGYAELLEKHWPGLVAHRMGPEPAPDVYFTNQIGSAASVLAYLDAGAVEPAVTFITELTELWVGLVEGAEPRVDHAEEVEKRRVALMKRAYKGLDYHSPASDGLAAVLGWRGANLMFDHVFGPDAVPQVADARRTYLDVQRSPGAAPKHD